MAPGTSPQDELLAKALLYEHTYKGFGLDRDRVAAEHSGFFTREDLTLFKYVDTHPQAQDLFHAVISQHEQMKQLDANQPRMWHDGSIASAYQVAAVENANSSSIFTASAAPMIRPTSIRALGPGSRPLGRAISRFHSDDQAALLLGDLGQSSALLTLVASQQG